MFGSLLFVFLATVPARAEEVPLQRVRDTRFNHQRGFYTSDIDVLIRSRTPGARIRYTLDGTPPTPTSGMGEANPVSIPVGRTTTLRAIAYKEGMLPSNVDTQTYIFVKDVLKQPAHIPGYPEPVLRSGVGEFVPLDYEMDPQVVEDYWNRHALFSGLQSIPTISIVMDRDDLFKRVDLPETHAVDASRSGVYWADRGDGSTRPASVEILYPHQPGESMQVDAAVEGHSWPLVKRALRLKFKKEYGPAKLRSSLFEKAPLNGDTAVGVYDRIVLRSGNNRSWATSWSPNRTSYTRDQWARDTQIAMSGLSSHGTFVHLYLNGLYWGLYNACERPDAWFLAAHLGGKMEDWFSVNQDGPFQGESARWNYLRGPLKDKDMREEANYRELQQYLDVAQFADYLILCWYMRLVDWPENNWYAGHRIEPPSPLMFFVWDAEQSWNARAWIHPRFRAAEDSRERSMVGIWHSLRKNREFMLTFADRVYRHCFGDGALTEAAAVARWRTLNDFIADAILAESARWGDARSSLGETTRTRDNTFYPAVNRVAAMMKGNVQHFIAELREEGFYPSIDPPKFRYSRSLSGRRSLEMDNPNDGGGIIYYTLNGMDPRAPGGTLAPGAFKTGDRQRNEIVLDTGSTLKARVKAGDEWSALGTTSSSNRGFWIELMDWLPIKRNN